MLSAALLDVLSLVGILALCGAMYYLASRIEPHWVSKDQSRFLTVAQDLDQHGLPIGRRRDVRVQFAGDQRSLVVGRRSLMRTNPALWTVKSKKEVSRRRAAYVLRPAERVADVALLAIRVPHDSKVVARLDALLELTGDDATVRRERERYRADQQSAEEATEATEASGSPGMPPPDPPTDRD